MLGLSLEPGADLPPPKKIQRNRNRKGTAIIPNYEPCRPPKDEETAQKEASSYQNASKYRSQYNRIVGLEIQQELQQLIDSPTHDLDFDLLFNMIITELESRSWHYVAG